MAEKFSLEMGNTSYSHCPQCGQQTIGGQFLCGHSPAAAPTPVEPPLAICECGHLKGIHWHRKDAGETRVRVEECAEPNCACRKYVPTAQPAKAPSPEPSIPADELEFFENMTACRLSQMRIRMGRLESGVRLALHENEITRCGLRKEVCDDLRAALAAPSGVTAGKETADECQH
jgi:hypothetical protein